MRNKPPGIVLNKINKAKCDAPSPITSVSNTAPTIRKRQSSKAKYEDSLLPTHQLAGTLLHPEPGNMLSIDLH